MGVVLCILDGFTDPEFDPADYPALSGLRRLGDVDTALGEKPESLNCILHLLGIRNVPPLLRGYAEALGDDIPVGENDLILRGSWFSRDETGRCVAPMAAPGGNSRRSPLPVRFPGRIQKSADFSRSWRIRKGTHHLSPLRSGGQVGGGPVSQGLPGSGSRVSGFMLPPVLLHSLGPVPAHRPAALPGKGVRDFRHFRGPGHRETIGYGCLDRPRRYRRHGYGPECQAVFAALDAAEKYPFVLLHINGTDEASHRKDAMEKRAFLSRVDAEIIRPLATNLPFFIVTGDHAADPRTGNHAGTPQPVFINRFT